MMEIDIQRILEYDYLLDLKNSISEEISRLSQEGYHEYTLDELIGIDRDFLKNEFGEYGLLDRFKNVLILLNNPEMRGLQLSRLMVSFSKVQTIRQDAIETIKLFNEKRKEKYEIEVREKLEHLTEELSLIDRLILCLHSDYVINLDDVEFLRKIILDISLPKISKEIVSSIKGNLRIVSENQEELIDESEIEEFDSLVEGIYANHFETVMTSDNILDEENVETDNNIREFYESHKELFNEYGIFNITSWLDDLRINEYLEYKKYTLEDFVILLVSLLDKTRTATDETDLEEIWQKIYEIDSMYPRWLELKREHVLEQSDKVIRIKEKITVLSNMNNFGQAELLMKELEEILRDADRNIWNEIDVFDIDLDKLEKKVDLAIDFVNTLEKINLLFGQTDNENHRQLSIIQAFVMELIGEINNLSLEDVEKYNAVKEKITDIENGYVSEKISIRSFILFDYDENKEPYILRDLNPRRSKLIDTDKFKPNELTGAFEDFSNLVNELLINGNVEYTLAADSTTTSYRNKIMDAVYFDPESREHPTGMYRIRPTRNSFCRFIEQKVVFRKGTSKFERMINIIKKYLPNVEMALNEDDEFWIYVNVATGLKKDEGKIYNTAINRQPKSDLLKIINKADDEMTDDDYLLLEEVVKSTLDAYHKLGTENDLLSFEIIEQLERGERTHEL